MNNLFNLLSQMLSQNLGTNQNTSMQNQNNNNSQKNNINNSTYVSDYPDVFFTKGYMNGNSYNMNQSPKQNDVNYQQNINGINNNNSNFNSINQGGMFNSGILKNLLPALLGNNQFQNIQNGNMGLSQIMSLLVKNKNDKSKETKEEKNNEDTVIDLTDFEEVI